MQDMDTREMQKALNNYAYKKVRSNGSSHVIYEREVVVKDTISIPTNGKTISGPMAKRLLKQMRDFENYICQSTRGVK